MSGLAIALREVRDTDYEALFAIEEEREGNLMAAFTPIEAQRGAFDQRWTKIMANDRWVKRVIVLGGAVVGSIASFNREEEWEITYRIGRAWWGRGITTSAVGLFLPLVPQRPLMARAAMDNAPSIRVLEKNGFRHVGTGKYFAESRGREIDEVILRLD